MKLVSILDPDDLPASPPGHAGWPWTLPEGDQLEKNMKLKWPTISIITPSYNQGRFIEQAIRSVLLQRYPRLEYVVIDGGSSDETSSVLQAYAPYLSHLQSRVDAGQADALAQGFQLASGDILAWINADDFYEPFALERVARFFLAHPRTVFANGDVNLVDENGQKIRKLYAMRPSRFFAANLGVHGWPQQGCFWLRSAYKAAGGVDPSFQFAMDLDLFTRLVQLGDSRRLQGGAVANFRIHPAAKSARLRPVLHQEKTLVMARYGRPFWTSKPILMGALWWLYRKQASARARWEALLRRLKA